MSRLDAAVLKIWLTGETTSVLLRHAGRLGCTLADEAAIERLAEAAGIDWRTVRAAAIADRNGRIMERIAGMSEMEIMDLAIETHGTMKLDAYDALEAAAREDKA